MSHRTKGTMPKCPVRDRIEELVAAPGSPDPNAKITGGARPKKVRASGEYVPHGEWGKKYRRSRQSFHQVRKIYCPLTNIAIGIKVIYKRAAKLWEYHVLTPRADEMMTHVVVGMLNFVS